MFLSAWMSRSKIPAEQLKIAGQLEERLEAAGEDGVCPQGRCLVNRPGKQGPELVCGGQAVLDCASALTCAGNR